MKSITQKQFGARSQEFGIKKLRTTNSLLRTILLFALIFMAFCLGLLLGGTTIGNKTKTLIRGLDDTREMLQKHPSSVIIIKSDVADAVGFEPRNRYDLKLPSPLVGEGKVGIDSQRGEGGR